MKKPLRQKGQNLKNLWRLCLCFLVLGVLAGCGGSEPSESSVVPPPAPVVVDDDAPTDKSPPGGIEMPPGDIPLPKTDEAPDSESGIQMPEGLEVPKDTQSQSGVEASRDSGVTQVDLKYATWDEIQAFAKSSGRITVLDLWSLSCEPCLKEFPGLVRLHKTLGASVQCIAVDVDFDGRKSRPPEHYEDRVAAFLGSVGASGFPTFISRTPSDDVFATTKLASIPAVLVYSADGEIAKIFVDAGETAGFTYDDDVIPLVTRLSG